MTAIILVIGQEQWDTKSFRIALTQAGYRVAAAEPQAAIATIQYYRPALIIACLSGNEPADLNLCRKLVDIGNAPIIAVDSPQDTECQLAAFDAGVDDYLTRPVNLQELAARVRGILRRRCWLPSTPSTPNISTLNSLPERNSIKMKKRLMALLTVIFCVSWFAGSMNTAGADTPTVHAVLFYDLQCPHCEVVREQVLPPLQTRYGNQFIITQLEINDSRVYDIFLAALDQYAVPPEMRGVPFLIVGDVALIGSQDIPDQLPGLIDIYLATGGVDYPAVPGLEPLLDNPPGPGEPVEKAPDPVANALAIAVMIGMVAAMGYVTIMAVRGWRTPQPAVVTHGLTWRSWIVPVLALIGLGVATYLAYVETTETLAVCGPVGDCNAVQSSPYAKLFGIPIGLWGALTYLAILGLWAMGHFGRGRPAQLAFPALFGLAVFGVLFSLYLTYLEPFVIGAVCAWCLTSAVTITLLLLAVTGPGLSALTGIINRTRVVWQEEQA